jgi:DHA2 family multidrug resistance protein
MAENTNSAEPWRPKANPWLIAVVVAMAAFMENIDTSIANVALPYMVGNLGASNDERRGAGVWPGFPVRSH